MTADAFLTLVREIDPDAHFEQHGSYKVLVTTAVGDPRVAYLLNLDEIELG